MNYNKIVRKQLREAAQIRLIEKESVIQRSRKTAKRKLATL